MPTINTRSSRTQAAQTLSNNAPPCTSNGGRRQRSFKNAPSNNNQFPSTSRVSSNTENDPHGGPLDQPSTVSQAYSGPWNSQIAGLAASRSGQVAQAIDAAVQPLTTYGCPVMKKATSDAGRQKLPAECSHVGSKAETLKHSEDFHIECPICKYDPVTSKPRTHSRGFTKPTEWDESDHLKRHLSYFMCVHGCGAGFFTKEARKDHHVNCIEKDQPEKNKQPGPKELEKIYQKLRDDSIRKADAENPEEWRKVKPRIMRELEALLLQQDDKGKLVKKFDAYDLTNRLFTPKNLAECQITSNDTITLNTPESSPTLDQCFNSLKEQIAYASQDAVATAASNFCDGIEPAKLEIFIHVLQNKRNPAQWRQTTDPQGSLTSSSSSSPSSSGTPSQSESYASSVSGRPKNKRAKTSHQNMLVSNGYLKENNASFSAPCQEGYTYYSTTSDTHFPSSVSTADTSFPSSATTWPGGVIDPKLLSTESSNISSGTSDTSMLDQDPTTMEGAQKCFHGTAMRGDALSHMGMHDECEVLMNNPVQLDFDFDFIE
ncbi:Protein of unknown function [Pyronema omphalodes CBS 100304]|uniref:Uncharacterized protein n=1 Tax=Pyronema omphalodes (strain CBS 100304) TaxID=1076935 RepID=U4KWP4_PYROM|nr:Protein of unknown function [Pyronema omphalodes CBS 100304]